MVYLAFPLVAFLDRLIRDSDRGFGAPGLWPALAVSVEGATISLALIGVLGIPLAYVLARHPGPLATLVGVVVQVPLALPPLMSGILLVYVVGPYSYLGRHFGGNLTESLTGVVIAQSFVAAPFLVVAARSAFATVDPSFGDLAATLGHRGLSRFLRVDLRCALPGIRAGMVLTWLRAFGEYGATVIVAYHPFSLPIYTANQFLTSPLSTSEAPTVLALGAAAVVVLLGQATFRLPRRGRPLPPPRPPTPRAPRAVGFDLDTSVGDFRLRVAHPAGAARLAVLGPSGSGKSMTLRALAGLLGPGAGSVTYAGDEVRDVPPQRRRVGYVPQGLGLLPGLSVRRQVLFGVHADPALAAWWIATLQLDGLLDRYPDQLSGGQRQRVSLARALACDPELVLLDEPFSALDAPVRAELRRELRRLQREAGLSTVIVTHDPVEAAFLADDVVVIADGAVLQDDPVPVAFRRPRSPQIAALLGIDNVHTAAADASGVVRVAGVPLPTTAAVAGGATVLWSVAPEQVTVTPDAPDGHGPANEGPAGLAAWTVTGLVLDVVDLGTVIEVSVEVAGELVLRSRSLAGPEVAVGDRCRISVAAITTWLVPEQEVVPGQA
ncbi:ATP-binding cassette domain-containing protein [Jatrophihabitans sp.]|uniref:ABC transporter ATP-binding protein/permease n=1 Tax=Jatrophihabitans sp. TaxID=1932789 RepID=UPI0030C6E103|nr:transporter related [Jatrophihabitans sp.]